MLWSCLTLFHSLVCLVGLVDQALAMFHDVVTAQVLGRHCDCGGESCRDGVSCLSRLKVKMHHVEM